jgi:hypothetical protein
MGANGNIWYRKVAECCHEHTISVISDGVEREICEDCGNVAIRYESMIGGSVERSAFSRKADQERLPGSAERRWPAERAVARQA